MKVEFVAALPHTNAIRFDEDGAGHMRLEFSSDQAPDTVKLLLCTGRVLKVTVETSGEDGDDPGAAIDEAELRIEDR